MPLIKFKKGSFTEVYCPVPVKGVYFTLDDANPSAEWPGTEWTKLTGGVVALAGTAGYAAAGTVGGSKTISVGQLPSHSHPYIDSGRFTWNVSEAAAAPAWGTGGNVTSARSGNTGGGADYYPLHVSINAWARTA